jgi:hypothetical protein
MAQGSTTFPTTLDSAISNPSTQDMTEAAMLAVQTKVGIDSSTVAASLDYKSRQKEVAVYAADGAISIDSHKLHVLTKTSAGAYTLAAPTAAQAGQILHIVAGTAFAHVVTATDLLDDGVTGGAKDTATFGAFVGSAMTLIAYNLKWIVISKNVVTIAAV